MGGEVRKLAEPPRLRGALHAARRAAGCGVRCGGARVLKAVDSVSGSVGAVLDSDVEDEVLVVARARGVVAARRRRVWIHEVESVDRLR